MTEPLDRDGSRTRRDGIGGAGIVRASAQAAACCGLLAITIPSSGTAASSSVQRLTCTEEALVEVENAGERVEVKQHKPDQTYRAYLVIDRSRSRLGVASSVVPEFVFARISHADEATIRTLGEPGQISTGVWAIDTKRMNALYVRALAGGDNPPGNGLLVGALWGKMVYYHCVAGWPAEMLKAR